jgi:Holliday junction DNA helicase RuvA
MIALLNGSIASINAFGDVVIDVQGVGYKVSIPENETMNLKTGDLVVMHISTHVRDDAITLYGFTDASARDLFDKLTSVSGVGGRLALAMISVLSPRGIVDALDSSDVEMLCRVPGIGKKTAQRMIVELSNVAGIKDLFLPTVQNTQLRDVQDALEELGYRREEIAHVINDLDPDLSLDVMIKECLRLLSSPKVS